eukprot:g33637.t1
MIGMTKKPGFMMNHSHPLARARKTCDPCDPCIGQGGSDLKLRQKASEAAAAMPASVAGLLPERPRFLPLCKGTPIEVLQAVMLGVDVFELTYPAEAAVAGLALTFECELPEGFEVVDSDREAAGISEARLYSLEARLADEMDARIAFECKVRKGLQTTPREPSDDVTNLVLPQLSQESFGPGYAKNGPPSGRRRLAR